MKDLKKYLDSTFLKTVEDFGGDEAVYKQHLEKMLDEAIEEEFKLVMIRPESVSFARSKVDGVKSAVLVGTVIDFPLGDKRVEEKLQEAAKAIDDGADELDFVVDYKAFKRGEVTEVREEIEECTLFALGKGKVVKWIIEVAALTDKEIIQLTTLVKKVVLSKCEEKAYQKVFVKSSTGFYKVEEGKTNGATLHSLVLMLENSGPLPIKAAGGIRNRKDALSMLRLGVRRLGTSAAKEIVSGEEKDEHSDY